MQGSFEKTLADSLSTEVQVYLTAVHSDSLQNINKYNMLANKRRLLQMKKKTLVITNINKLRLAIRIRI